MHATLADHLLCKQKGRTSRWAMSACLAVEICLILSISCVSLKQQCVFANLSSMFTPYRSLNTGIWAGLRFGAAGEL